MKINQLTDLLEAVRTQGKKKLVVAYAQDTHTLEAVSDAVEQCIAEATLIGDPVVIRQICKREGLDDGKFEIIAETGDVKCVETAVRMANSGMADVVMKGLVSTDKYMRGILHREYGLVPPKGTLSHAIVLQLPEYHKLLVVSDVAVIPYPTLDQKRVMIRYLIEMARAIGIEHPKVACIAPSEQVLPGMTSSTDAALLAKMGERGDFGDAVVEGPLALDVAMFPEVARMKHLQGSRIEGDADCLLFPNLDAANVFFKCATRLNNAGLAGLVVGTRVPCVLTSRADTRFSKLCSIALGCLTAK